MLRGQGMPSLEGRRRATSTCTPASTSRVASTTSSARCSSSSTRSSAPSRTGDDGEDDGGLFKRHQERVPLTMAEVESGEAASRPAREVPVDELGRRLSPPVSASRRGAAPAASHHCSAAVLGETSTMTISVATLAEHFGAFAPFEAELSASRPSDTTSGSRRSRTRLRRADRGNAQPLPRDSRLRRRRPRAGAAPDDRRDREGRHEARGLAHAQEKIAAQPAVWIHRATDVGLFESSSAALATRSTDSSSR